MAGGLESAFARFGSVARERSFDQLRAVVASDKGVAGGELVLNAEFLRFAAHWGPTRVRVGRIGADEGQGRAAGPLHPCRLLRRRVCDEDLNEQSLRWREGTAKVRRHGILGEPPVDRFDGDDRGEAVGPLASCSYRRFGVHRVGPPACV